MEQSNVQRQGVGHGPRPLWSQWRGRRGPVSDPFLIWGQLPLERVTGEAPLLSVTRHESLPRPAPFRVGFLSSDGLGHVALSSPHLHALPVLSVLSSCPQTPLAICIPSRCIF